MANDNVEAFRRWVECLQEGDVEAGLALAHSQVVMEPLRAATEGTFVGHAGLREFVDDTDATFDLFEPTTPMSATLATAYLRSARSRSAAAEAAWRLTSLPRRSRNTGTDCSGASGTTGTPRWLWRQRGCPSRAERGVGQSVCITSTAPSNGSPCAGVSAPTLALRACPCRSRLSPASSDGGCAAAVPEKRRGFGVLPDPLGWGGHRDRQAAAGRHRTC